MKILRQCSLNEKLAIGLFLLFCPVYWFLLLVASPSSPDSSELVVTSLLWIASWLLALVVAILVATGAVAFEPKADHSRLRQVVGRVLPIAGLALSLGLTWSISNHMSQANKMAFVAKNEMLLVGDAPRAVIYSEGVPDGGYAVVRSPDENPTRFSQSQMIALTGERVKSCEKLSAKDWFCHFD